MVGIFALLIADTDSVVSVILPRTICLPEEMDTETFDFPMIHSTFYTYAHMWNRFKSPSVVIIMAYISSVLAGWLAGWAR